MTALLALERRVAELERRLANVVRYGAVEQVDAPAARVRVRYSEDAGDGPALTAWIPWLAAWAGEARSWRQPSVGEQVALLAPYGALEAATALPGLPSDAFPPPGADPGTAAVLLADGARIAYDAEAGELSAILPAGARLRIEAPGGAALTGDLAVDGDISATGSVSADADVSARGGVSDRLGSLDEMRSAYNPHVHPIAPGGAILPTTQKMT